MVCVPQPSFSAISSSKPSWTFYRDRANPFRDSASGDYTACAKAPSVLAHLPDSPPELQETIRQALIDETYVDDGGVGPESKELLSNCHVWESCLFISNLYFFKILHHCFFHVFLSQINFDYFFTLNY